MHLTRPKSSKGRNRPAVTDVQGSAASPDRPERSLRSRSQPTMRPAGQLGHDGVLQMLQHAPAAPPQSLNKYKVLPSIERRQSERGPGTHELPDPPDPPDPGPAAPGGLAGGLLLAVRAPCGRRFEQHFEPTDALLAVRASAEVRYGARYGGASIETAEVPRRSFTCMDKTLAECGILNRSVLRISQGEGEVELE